MRVTAELVRGSATPTYTANNAAAVLSELSRRLRQCAKPGIGWRACWSMSEAERTTGARPSGCVSGLAERWPSEDNIFCPFLNKQFCSQT